MSGPGSTRFEEMSVALLRDKMKEHGFDVPTSVGKEFMVKKLRSLELSGSGGGKPQNKGRASTAKKVSVAPRKKSPTPPPTTRQRTDRSSSSRVGGAAASSSAYHEAASRTPSGSSNSSVDDYVGENTRSSGRTHGDIIYSRASNSAREPTSTSSSRLRQSSPSVSRSMTRASAGRVTKQQEPSWSSSRSSRSATRVKSADRGGGSDDEYEETTTGGGGNVASAAAYQNLQGISQFHQAHFSPMMTGMNSRNQTNATNAASAQVQVFQSNMFGVIVPGRMVTTDFIANQPVGATKFEFELKEADKVDYLVIFLTGNEPFPPGSGGQIFFGWKNPIKGDAVDDWVKLGFITNEKPSAIYKISDLRNFFLQQAALQGNPQQVFPFHTATLGIDVQPLENILKSISPQLEL